MRKSHKPLAATMGGLFVTLCAKGEMRYFLTILVMLGLTACNVEHELYLMKNEPFEVWVKNNEVLSKGNREVVLPGSAKHDKFIVWVAKNKQGWRHTPATYITGDVLVEGKGYSFNFLSGSVVLNYKTMSGEYDQLVKVVAPGSYKYLSE